MQLRRLGERVVLYDGKLQVNPSEPRGFILRAQIPLGVPAL
jgi:hypothetical protein